jgi:hypothetical protein
VSHEDGMYWGRGSIHYRVRKSTGDPSLVAVSHTCTNDCSTFLLTAVDVFTIFVLTRQSACLVSQSVQLTSSKSRFMLKVAELALLALASEVKVVTHLFTKFMHTDFEGLGGPAIARRERIIKSLLSFIEISVFLL